MHMLLLLPQGIKAASAVVGELDGVTTFCELAVPLVGGRGVPGGERMGVRGPMRVGVDGFSVGGIRTCGDGSCKHRATCTPGHMHCLFTEATTAAAVAASG